MRRRPADRVFRWLIIPLLAMLLQIVQPVLAFGDMAAAMADPLAEADFCDGQTSAPSHHHHHDADQCPACQACCVAVLALLTTPPALRIPVLLPLRLGVTRGPASARGPPTSWAQARSPPVTS
jgi:hypothetical protein